MSASPTDPSKREAAAPAGMTWMWTNELLEELAGDSSYVLTAPPDAFSQLAREFLELRHELGRARTFAEGAGEANRQAARELGELHMRNAELRGRLELLTAPGAAQADAELSDLERAAPALPQVPASHAMVPSAQAHAAGTISNAQPLVHLSGAMAGANECHDMTHSTGRWVMNGVLTCMHCALRLSPARIGQVVTAAA